MYGKAQEVFTSRLNEIERGGLFKRERTIDSPQQAETLCLNDVDTLTDSTAKSELMVSVKGGELSERLLVGGVRWREPSVGIEFLWVRVDFWIA